MAIGALQTGYTTLYGKIAGLGTQNGQTRGSNFREHIDGTEKKAALVLAASENTYGDTGVFCAISRAKNIYACGMELDKYITKIKAGKMYKYMQTRELFSRGEKHEKQDVTYGG